MYVLLAIRTSNSNKVGINDETAVHPEYNGNFLLVGLSRGTPSKETGKLFIRSMYLIASWLINDHIIA